MDELRITGREDTPSAFPPPQWSALRKSWRPSASTLLIIEPEQSEPPPAVSRRVMPAISLVQVLPSSQATLTLHDPEQPKHSSFCRCGNSVGL